MGGGDQDAGSGARKAYHAFYDALDAGDWRHADGARPNGCAREAGSRQEEACIGRQESSTEGQTRKEGREEDGQASTGKESCKEEQQAVEQVPLQKVVLAGIRRLG